MSDDVLGPVGQARIRTRIEEGLPLSELDRRLYERAIERRHAWALALAKPRSASPETPPRAADAQRAIDHGEAFLQALTDVGASFRRRSWSKPGVGTRVYLGAEGYVSIGQDGTLREVSRGVVTFDPRSLFPSQRAKYREAVELYLQRLRAGAAGGQFSGFDLFDDESEAPIRLYEDSLRATLGPSYAHPAERLLRSEVLPLLRAPVVYHFIKSRAWAVEVKDDVDPHKVGAALRRALVGKRSLTSADPFLHDMTLHVVGTREVVVYPAKR